MAEIPSALIEATALAVAFEVHDPRPHQAAMRAYEDLSPERLDAVREALWHIIEHPAVDAPVALQCMFVMELLKVQRWMV
jgi:hypothetical protein